MQHLLAAASVVWLWACPASCGSVSFPTSLQKSLVLRLESDSGVQTDGETSHDEPAVVSWKDLSGHDRHAQVNATADCNAQQRAKNEKEDGTRPTDETYKLPRAKRRVAAMLHDAAPALVTCPTLNVPAIFFDGDDYMFIPTVSKKDLLTPLKGGFSVVAMLSVAAAEEGQQHFFNHWLGLGHPGVMSDSQYTLHSRGVEEEEVFGKGGKKKAPKKIGTPKGSMSIRVVPVMHDKDIPSVREHAEIEGEMNLNEPVLVSFHMTGKKIYARTNGEVKPWKTGAAGFSEGSWTYRGKVDPHADAPGSPFYLGAGPSAEHLIDFTGEGAHGLLYGVLVFRKKLEPKELQLAENYLACHFNFEAKCDREAARKAGMLHEEL